MKNVNSIHKSPRMFCLGGHILGQLLASKPTIVQVYLFLVQRGTATESERDPLPIENRREK